MKSILVDESMTLTDQNQVTKTGLTGGIHIWRKDHGCYDTKLEKVSLTPVAAIKGVF